MFLWQKFADFAPTNYALHQEAKDNAVKEENLVRTVQRNFYMDDFLKSVRTPQVTIEIYQNVRDILIKSEFNLTKWITSDDEVKSQIPETDRSTKVVITCETEPQSSSILGLTWNVDTDSLIVCRGTEREVPVKITQRIVLSFVSAVFHPPGLCSPFTIRMRFLLKSIWAAMGQAWDKELSAERPKLFSYWCSELREKKDDVSKSTLFRKPMFKLETAHFHRHVRRSDVRRGIYARRGDAKTCLYDRKMSCGTHETNDKTKIRTQGLNLRSWSQKADTQRT